MVYIGVFCWDEYRNHFIRLKGQLQQFLQKTFRGRLICAACLFDINHKYYIPPLKTNEYFLKIDGWKMNDSFPLKNGPFSWDIRSFSRGGYKNGYTPENYRKLTAGTWKWFLGKGEHLQTYQFWGYPAVPFRGCTAYCSSHPGSSGARRGAFSTCFRSWRRWNVQRTRWRGWFEKTKTSWIKSIHSKFATMLGCNVFWFKNSELMLCAICWYL